MTGTPQRHERKQNAASTNPQEISNGTAKEDIVSPGVIELVHHNKHHLLSHSELPDWLRGNEFLSHFHRPPMPCFRSCFKSIFKLHSETGNIWTHLIGFIAFVCITSYMLVRPVTEAYPFPGDWREKLVFSCFFVGAILCLGVSWIFHTVYCHSKTISKIFRRLVCLYFCNLICFFSTTEIRIGPIARRPELGSLRNRILMRYWWHRFSKKTIVKGNERKRSQGERKLVT